jgi:hypothetical protein
VRVVLPDGAAIKGRVTSVGAATEKQQNDGTSTVVIPTTISLAGQHAARGFQRASVSVRIAGVQKKNILSVAVDALIALDDTHFGVEVPNADGSTRRLPVTTGLFAAGRVEVSGVGIREGLTVIVPQL